MTPQAAVLALERLQTVCSLFAYNAGPHIDIRDQGLTPALLDQAKEALTVLETREQRLRIILDELFQLAEPGPVKNALWQAYQRLDSWHMSQADREEQEQDIRERLARLGIEVSVTPAAYTLTHEDVSGAGPTLDLALIDLVESLLISPKKARR